MAAARSNRKPISIGRHEDEAARNAIGDRREWTFSVAMQVLYHLAASRRLTSSMIRVQRDALLRRALLQGRAIDDHSQLRGGGAIGRCGARRVARPEGVGNAGAVDRVERVRDAERIAEAVSSRSGNAGEGETGIR